MTQKNNLCVILARGGSKRLPGKNVMNFCGKPLIAHSIEQARQSGVFADVIVSSDSDEILKVSQDYGVDIALKRPSELATDEAKSLPVILHALKYAEDFRKKNYDSVTLLQVTSPLRVPHDIIKAVSYRNEGGYPSLISVHSVPSANPIESFNGSIYVWDRDRFVSEQNHIYSSTRYMLMPISRSIDIDFEADFVKAEKLYKSSAYRRGESELI